MQIAVAHRVPLEAPALRNVGTRSNPSATFKLRKFTKVIAKIDRDTRTFVTFARLVETQWHVSTSSTKPNKGRRENRGGGRKNPEMPGQKLTSSLGPSIALRVAQRHALPMTGLARALKHACCKCENNACIESESEAAFAMNG